MVDLKALLTSKKELAARLIALGIFGELANLIIFLTGTENHEALDDIEEEEGDLEEDVTTENPLVQNADQHLRHDMRVHLFLIIAFGIVAIVTFLLYLVDCCKQKDIFEGIVSENENWKSEAKELNKKMDEFKSQMETMKIDVLEDLEGNLFGNRGKVAEDCNEELNNNDEDDKNTELILTPKQVKVFIIIFGGKRSAHYFEFNGKFVFGRKVSWMGPEEASSVVGSLPQIRLN